MSLNRTNPTMLEKYTNAYNSIDIGLKGDGTTNDATKLNAWITNIGSTKVDLYFSSGIYKLGSNVTIPSNVRLIMANGAVFIVGSGVTLTFTNTEIKAGLEKIFDLSLGGVLGGTVKNNILPLQWFGAVDGGVVDSSNYIQYAINSLDNLGAYAIDGLNKTYLINKSCSLKQKTKILNATFLVTDTYIIEGNTKVFQCLSNIFDYELLFDNVHIKLLTNSSVVFDASHEGTLLWLNNIKSLDFKNGSILNLFNGYSNKCSCLWIRDNSANINIYKSTIKNNSSSTSGGTIWLWANNSAHTISNVKVSKCVLSHDTGDDTIAIWGNGTLRDIIFEKNEITLLNNNPSVMSFSITSESNTSTFKNIVFRKNNIIMAGKTQHIFYYNLGVSSVQDLSIIDNTIMFNNVSDSTIADVFSIMATINGGGNGITTKVKNKSN